MNKIIHGDNVEVLKTFDNECIDLTVTSPPYDNLRDYKGYTFDFESIAKELFRVTKQGGVVVWVVGDATINGSETGTSFKQALRFMDIGFRLHDTMIYRKTSPVFPSNEDSGRYSNVFEYMFILSKGQPKTINLIKDKINKYYTGKFMYNTNRQKDGTTKGTQKFVNPYGIRYNIWEYSPGYMKSTSDKQAYQHPAIFPEQLAQDHIVSWSNEGDIVLDPFCGSGTTCKMAYKLKRKYIGIDISKKYCEIAEQRVNNIKHQTNLFNPSH